MSDKLKLITSGANVAPIYWTLLEHPELWNEHTERTLPSDSPHRELDDIWVRYGEPERASDGEPHNSFWYPKADILAVRSLCHDVMRFVQGVELGGVLITRIPPGKQCYPHIDHGWHASRYDKYAVQITSAPGQEFHVEDVVLETKPGDIYKFDNSFSHWVTNPTAYERVTMIVCVRLDQDGANNSILVG